MPGSFPELPRAARAGGWRACIVVALCVFQPVNVLRHTRHMGHTVATHFGAGGRPALGTGVSFGTFCVVTIGGTAAVGAAFWVLAGRALEARSAVGWARNARPFNLGKLQAAKLGVCSGHALFWLGVIALAVADTVVWAVLEANEELPGLASQ